MDWLESVLKGDIDGLLRRVIRQWDLMSVLNSSSSLWSLYLYCPTKNGKIK